MITADAIKIAYRQSKDGFVVSFAIHPSDMPADLANADIGSQWQLRLVPLDGDGNPASDGITSTARSETREAPSSDSGVSRRPFTSLPLPQQAALLCNDPIFWTYINEKWGYAKPTNADDAAEHLRLRCAGIRSRSELASDKDAAEIFIADRDHFMAWKLVG